MEKYQADALALKFAAKVIENNPNIIFGESCETTDLGASRLANFVDALSNNFQKKLSDFINIPSID